MSLSTRIRIELLLGGPQTAAEIAKRMGRRNSHGLHAYLHHMQKAKKDPVIRVGHRYALKRAYTALQEWR